MMMWTDENTLLVHDLPKKIRRSVMKELKRSFPNVKIVTVADRYNYEEWNGFGSACNIYVNSLVTNNFIYVPTFNDPHDNEMVEFIKSNTSKEVVSIPAEQVCFMGGSVRCLSWQIDGKYADAILAE